MALVPHSGTYTDSAGNVITGATVTITDSLTGTASSLFTDVDGNVPVLGNVLLTDSLGTYSFYAAPGRYTIAITAAGYDDVERNEVLWDPDVLADDTGATLVHQLRSFTGAVQSTLQGWIEGRDIGILEAMTAADAVKVMAGTYDATLTAKAQAAIDALQSGQRLHVVGTLLLSGAGLNITNKNKVTICGGGTISIANAGADVDAVCLKLVGTCDRVTIEDLNFIGAGNTGATYFQYGVYSVSGQTLKNITVRGCHFKNLNAGASFNADSSGTYENVLCTGNVFEDMVGTTGGQGYGIHASRVVNMMASQNIIRRAQRHSIYFARSSTTAGQDFGMAAHGNIIEDHRSVGFDGNLRPAIYGVRGRGYSFKHNKIYDYWDGGIAVSHDTADSANGGDSVIEGNELFGRQNAGYSIFIAEAADPTSYRTRNVKVHGNTIVSDHAVCALQHDIIVFNGQDIEVSGNSIFSYNMANSAYYPFGFGNHAAAGATDFDNVLCKGNTVNGTLSGSGYSPITLAYVFSDICTGSARLKITDNEVNSDYLAATAAFQATQTNTKVVVQEANGGGTVGVYVNGDTSPSVFGGVTQLIVTNSAPINLASLDDGRPGQLVTLVFSDGNTTVKNATGNIRLDGGSDFGSTARDVLTLTYIGAAALWYQSGSASLNA